MKRETRRSNQYIKKGREITNYPEGGGYFGKKEI